MTHQVITKFSYINVYSKLPPPQGLPLSSSPKDATWGLGISKHFCKDFPKKKKFFSKKKKQTKKLIFSPLPAPLKGCHLGFRSKKSGNPWGGGEFAVVHFPIYPNNFFRLRAKIHGYVWGESEDNTVDTPPFFFPDQILRKYFMKENPNKTILLFVCFPPF